MNTNNHPFTFKIPFKIIVNPQPYSPTIKISINPLTIKKKNISYHDSFIPFMDINDPMHSQK